MATNILLGIGNPLNGDDGPGIYVAGKFRKDGWIPQVLPRREEQGQNSRNGIEQDGDGRCQRFNRYQIEEPGYGIGGHHIFLGEELVQAVAINLQTLIPGVVNFA
jgi:hypothetical protein